MKFVTSFSLLLLVSVFGAGQSSQFRSTEGRFSITMPGQPTESVVTVSKGTWENHSNTFTYTDADLNQYMVAYSDRTNAEPRKATNEEVFDKIRKGLLIATDGKLLRESAVTLNGIVGRELVIERSGDSVQTERLFFVGDRVYQVSVEVKKQTSQTVDVNGFLNSFTFAR